MAQLSNQASLSTDAYSTTPSTAAPKTGLTANHKKMGAIAAATVLLGGAVGLVLARPKDGDSSESVTDENSSPVTEQPTSTMPTDIDVAGKVTDSMSFNQAFGAARDEVGVGGVFSWHGRWYNTFEKEEWAGLSLEQRQDYTEMITGEKLPVDSNPSQVARTSVDSEPLKEVEPTIIEGHLNGQRVMGLDYNRDGIIDTLVMEGADGYTYRVVDARGDDGLDTLLRYDSLNGELVEIEKIDQPFVLSNDQFSQGLEASMSREVVDSILNEPDASTPSSATGDDVVDESEQDETIYLTNSSEPDDTYTNNGNVRDMDE